MANCYFIDFENVHNSGLNDLKDLNKEDLLFIFYTTNTQTISLDNINHLNNLGCKYELIKVPSGSQSLDMHLISYLGYAIGIHSENFEYIIISKDKDYDNIINFWTNRCNLSVKRLETMITNKTKSNTTIVEENNPQKQNLQEIPSTKNNDAISNESIVNILKENGFNNQDVIDKVNNIISKSIGQEKSLNIIHNELLKSFRDNGYKEIYNLLKPTLKKILPDDSAPLEDALPINEKVHKILIENKYSRDIFNDVASTVCKNIKQKNAKMLIYRAIVAKFGQQEGLKIYNLVKSLL